MQRADTRIDILAIRVISDSNHIRAEFMQDFRRNVVSSAMRAVHHDLKSTQIKAMRHRAFAEFNVATRGIINTSGTPQIFRRNRLHRFTLHLVDRRFDGALDIIRQFFTIGRKELDAIVFKRIM